MFKNYWKIAIPAAVVVLLGVSSPDANAVDYSKMSARLAGLLDADYRYPGQSVEDLKASMEFLGQTCCLIEADTEKKSWIAGESPVASQMRTPWRPP